MQRCEWCWELGVGGAKSAKGTRVCQIGAGSGATASIEFSLFIFFILVFYYLRQAMSLMLVWMINQKEYCARTY